MRDTISDLRVEQRLPLRVRVTTRPPLEDCWSVNITEAGIGLTARGGVEPQIGSVLELTLHLPGGDELAARGRVTWAAPSLSGPQPSWGVRWRQRTL